MALLSCQSSKMEDLLSGCEYDVIMVKRGTPFQDVERRLQREQTAKEEDKQEVQEIKQSISKGI